MNKVTMPVTMINPSEDDHFHATLNGFKHFFEEVSDFQVKPYTIFYLSEFGFPVTTACKIYNVENKPYAQHKNALLITFKEDRQRKFRYIRFMPYSSFLIYQGTVVANYDAYEKIEATDKTLEMKKSRYTSFDSQYLREIKELIKQTPIVEWGL